MSCRHCCFSISKFKDGENMSLLMYENILKRWGEICSKNNKYIVLGGGEPTLHPDFWFFLSLAQSYGHPWLATNGKNKKEALILARMAKKGYVHVVLSQDEFHEKIDEEVVNAFKEGLTEYKCNDYITWRNPDNKFDKREIRTVINPKNHGFAKKLKNHSEGCCCFGIQIRPNGDIFACGCEESPKIGNVNEGITNPKFKKFDLFSDCYKNVF